MHTFFMYIKVLEICCLQLVSSFKCMLFEYTIELTRESICGSLHTLILPYIKSD